MLINNLEVWKRIEELVAEINKICSEISNIYSCSECCKSKEFQSLLKHYKNKIRMIPEAKERGNELLRKREELISLLENSDLIWVDVSIWNQKKISLLEKMKEIGGKEIDIPFSGWVLYIFPPDTIKKGFQIKTFFELPTGEKGFCKSYYPEKILNHLEEL